MKKKVLCVEEIQCGIEKICLHYFFREGEDHSFASNLLSSLISLSAKDESTRKFFCERIVFKLKEGLKEEILIETMQLIMESLKREDTRMGSLKTLSAISSICTVLVSLFSPQISEICMKDKTNVRTAFIKLTETLCLGNDKGNIDADSIVKQLTPFVKDKDANFRKCVIDFFSRVFGKYPELIVSSRELLVSISEHILDKSKTVRLAALLFISQISCSKHLSPQVIEVLKTRTMKAVFKLISITVDPSSPFFQQQIIQPLESILKYFSSLFEIDWNTLLQSIKTSFSITKKEEKGLREVVDNFVVSQILNDIAKWIKVVSKLNDENQNLLNKILSERLHWERQIDFHAMLNCSFKKTSQIVEKEMKNCAKNGKSLSEETRSELSSILIIINILMSQSKIEERGIKLMKNCLRFLLILCINNNDESAERELRRCLSTTVKIISKVSESQIIQEAVLNYLKPLVQLCDNGDQLNETIDLIYKLPNSRKVAGNLLLEIEQEILERDFDRVKTLLYLIGSVALNNSRLVSEKIISEKQVEETNVEDYMKEKDERDKMETKIAEEQEKMINEGYLKRYLPLIFELAFQKENKFSEEIQHSALITAGKICLFSSSFSEKILPELCRLVSCWREKHTPNSLLTSELSLKILADLTKVIPNKVLPFHPLLFSNISQDTPLRLRQSCLRTVGSLIIAKIIHPQKGIESIASTLQDAHLSKLSTSFFVKYVKEGHKVGNLLLSVFLSNTKEESNAVVDCMLKFLTIPKKEENQLVESLVSILLEQESLKSAKFLSKLTASNSGVKKLLSASSDLFLLCKSRPAFIPHLCKHLNSCEKLKDKQISQNVKNFISSLKNIEGRNVKMVDEVDEFELVEVENPSPTNSIVIFSSGSSKRNIQEERKERTPRKKQKK